MKIRLLTAMFGAAVLVGCDPIYGPGLINLSEHSVRFRAAYSAGSPIEFELGPRQDFWQRHPDLELESLTIVDGAEELTYSASQIKTALSEMGTRGQAIAYLGKGRISGTTAKSWRK